MFIEGDLLVFVNEYQNVYGIFIHNIDNVIIVAIPNYGTWSYPKDMWIKV